MPHAFIFVFSCHHCHSLLCSEAAKRAAAKAAGTGGTGGRRRTGEGAGGGSGSSRLRLSSDAVDEDDLPVIRNLAQFPVNRRIPVHVVDSEDKLSQCWSHIKEAIPFIARPKKGKSLLKLLGVSWMHMIRPSVL